MIGFRKALMVTIAAALLPAGGASNAAVVVFDRVAVVGRPVQLIVLTKGRWFPEGGQRVTWSVGRTGSKQLLTGGDGYGFAMYTPVETGLKAIRAEYRHGQGSGTLLVMGPEERAILVDIDSALRESFLSVRPRRGARRAMVTVGQMYRLIYLHGQTGLGLARQWLEANELPESVVLSWGNADRLRFFERDGIQLHAIIGSADQVTAAEKYIGHRFSFQKSRAGRQVDSWEAVLDALKLQ
jgi:hypothetical protein